MFYILKEARFIIKLWRACTTPHGRKADLASDHRRCKPFRCA
jgi:hypothetical protein